MSAEEDTELKNLVAQTLENKGILPKIRAELRANVFLALEENPDTKETLLKNNELSAFVKIPMGALILNLIREFLEFFELEFTLSVFDPETKFGKEYSSIAKEKIMKELKIPEDQQQSPLLCKVIERVIKNGDFIVPDKEKSFEEIVHKEGGDTGHLIASPLPMNSTYVKEKLEDVPLSPIENEKSKEDDTIKEELISHNISESDSLAVPELNLDKSQRLENSEENLVLSSKEPKLSSPKSVPVNPAEIDFLTFTPVKETQSKEDFISSSLPSNSESKTVEKKENDKISSVLGDLPPLLLKPNEKGDKMSTIKAIIDQWPDLENEDESSKESKDSKDESNEDKSPLHLKTDRSEQSRKSDKTESADDFEEDISDLLNGHTPSDGQLTIDETISKVSCEADYLESI